MKVFVGTAYYGNLDREFEQCMIKLNAAHPEIRTFGVFDCSYIDQAKSIILSKSMEADVCIIVDHDMIFEPEAIVQLAESALEADAVVGAPYCTRAHDKGGARVAAGVDPPITFFEGGSRYKATCLAGGFLAIPTRVARDMVSRFGWGQAQTTHDAMAWPFFHCICEEGKWWGEDLSFCRRLDKMEEEYFVDTRIRVGHKGRYIYHIEDAFMSVPRNKSVIIEEEKP